MDLYDVAIARKLSGGGGGGSDFSKAEVTIIPLESAGSGFSLYDPEYEEAPWGYHCCHVDNGHFFAGSPNEVFEPTTFTIYWVGDSLTLQVSTKYVSSTGDVVYNSDDNTVTITGDCSVTGYVED